MVITKTPFRMSFFGGGTDIESYFSENKGAVISSTFDKYCYVTVRHLPRFFEYRSEFVYSVIERVSGIDEIRHPLIRHAMNACDMREIRLSYEADLPARSGLGTSSSFAVSMLNAFYSLKGKHADKRKLADEAIYLERVLCGEAGGWQDQIAASFGGLNRIDFHSGGYDVSPVIIKPERKRALENNLMLFFTGFTRFSSDVQKSNVEDMKTKVSQLKKMYALVDEAERILTDSQSDIDEFGGLLDYTWKLKRQTGSAITTDSIDALYEKGVKAGALGGKLLGAGRGGFMLFYAPENKKDSVRAAMGDLLYVPFEFENSGTQVLYYVAEDYSTQETGFSI
ncbi:MAG: kinase [Clostridiales bacterium]|jgi:D-glycero-alpha-D-manno-heptose-7-phosphate kinase|nr:kinase [Clostridiales bacterium]